MSELLPVQIIYDGHCPFCRGFAGMVRLTESYKVELINAREPHALVDAATKTGLDLDEGMIIVVDGVFYHGVDAMNRMALMTAKNGMLRRLTKWTFASPERSRLIYPVLRSCRNLSLRVLGHDKIRNIQGD